MTFRKNTDEQKYLTNVLQNNHDSKVFFIIKFKNE